MPLVDVFEVALHVGELANLELLRKGLYRVELVLLLTSPDGAAERRCPAVTSSAAPGGLTSLSRLMPVGGTDAATEPGGIDDDQDGGAYVTRAVHLRYTDERFELNEAVVCRAEAVRPPPGAPPRLPRLGVRATLLRAECGTPPGDAAQGKAAAAAGGVGSLVELPAPPTRLGPFERVSTLRLDLGPLAAEAGDGGSAAPGTAAVAAAAVARHAFVPLLFDASYLCCAGLSVHVAHVTTRFVAPPPRPAPRLAPPPQQLSSTDAVVFANSTETDSSSGSSEGATAVLRENDVIGLTGVADDDAAGDGGFSDAGGGSSDDGEEGGDDAFTDGDASDTDVVDDAAVGESAAARASAAREQRPDDSQGPLLPAGSVVAPALASPRPTSAPAAAVAPPTTTSTSAAPVSRLAALARNVIRAAAAFNLAGDALADERATASPNTQPLPRVPAGADKAASAATTAGAAQVAPRTSGASAPLSAASASAASAAGRRGMRRRDGQRRLRRLSGASSTSNVLPPPTSLSEALFPRWHAHRVTDALAAPPGRRHHRHSLGPAVPPPQFTPLTAPEARHAYATLVVPVAACASRLGALLAHIDAAAAAGESLRREREAAASLAARQQFLASRVPPARTRGRTRSSSGGRSAAVMPPSAATEPKWDDGDGGSGLLVEGAGYSPSRFPWGVRSRAAALAAAAASAADDASNTAAAPPHHASADAARTADAFAASAVAEHGDDPEAVASLIVGALEEAAATTYARWRALQRALSRHAFAATGQLQAAYRAAALLSLRPPPLPPAPPAIPAGSALLQQQPRLFPPVVRVDLPPHALTDPAPALATALAAEAKRRRQLLLQRAAGVGAAIDVPPGVEGAGGGAAAADDSAAAAFLHSSLEALCHGGVPLDATLATLRQAVIATVTTYTAPVVVEAASPAAARPFPALTVTTTSTPAAAEEVLATQPQAKATEAVSAASASAASTVSAPAAAVVAATVSPHTASAAVHSAEEAIAVSDPALVGGVGSGALEASDAAHAAFAAARSSGAASPALSISSTGSRLSRQGGGRDLLSEDAPTTDGDTTAAVGVDGSPSEPPVEAAPATGATAASSSPLSTSSSPPSEGGPSPSPTLLLRPVQSPPALESATGATPVHLPSLFATPTAAAGDADAVPVGGGGSHVVVFLNGLGGSVHDSRQLRAHLKVHAPALVLLSVESHQAKATEGDLVAAAATVAEEVSVLVTTRLASDGLPPLGALSFVAFSLGGLVARLALRHPALRPFRGRLHAFVTVATPHLGLLYSSSQLLSAGMFLLQRLRGSAALAQLSLSDEPGGARGSVRNCLLYLLACGWGPAAVSATGSGSGSGGESAESPVAAAGGVTPTPTSPSPSPLPSPTSAAADTPTLRALTAGGFSGEPNGALLAGFRHVVLLSSPQDGYAPPSSCAVHWCDAALGDPRHGPGYGEMLRGFFAGSDPARVTRVELTFRGLPSLATAGGGGGQGAAGASAGGGAAGAGAAASAMAPTEVVAPGAGGGNGAAGGATGGGLTGALAAGVAGVTGGLSRALDAALGREAHVAFLETPAVGALLALGLQRGLWGL